MYRSCRVLGPDIAGYVNVHLVGGGQTICRPRPLLFSNPPYPIASVYAPQWQATDFVDEDWLNIKYPTKAPTATASITQPLYVMKSSLHTSAPNTTSNATRINLHDEERVKHLHSIQNSLDNLHLLLGTPPNTTVSP